MRVAIGRRVGQHGVLVLGHQRHHAALLLQVSVSVSIPLANDASALECPLVPATPAQPVHAHLHPVHQAHPHVQLEALHGRQRRRRERKRHDDRLLVDVVLARLEQDLGVLGRVHCLEEEDAIGLAADVHACLSVSRHHRQLLKLKVLLLIRFPPLHGVWLWHPRWNLGLVAQSLDLRRMQGHREPAEAACVARRWRQHH